MFRIICGITMQMNLSLGTRGNLNNVTRYQSFVITQVSYFRSRSPQTRSFAALVLNEFREFIINEN